LRPGLALWALEQRGGSAALIRANADRLGVAPAGVVEGRAPAALTNLPDPDRVVIGGGGSERADVVAEVLRRLRPGGVVVIPWPRSRAWPSCVPFWSRTALAVTVGQHQAWRGAPLAGGTRLAPMNPVLILKGQKP
jgi:precorrin-6Y C5,15-methyltransferase (decarboxylating)